jgi:RNA polymerase sigma-70 factor (ECF subfamily)
MVAVLSRFLGLKRLDQVEDIVQETFTTALLSWRSGKIPEDPPAWLMTVAKRKAIDFIRKRNAESERESHVQLSGPAGIIIEELFMDSEIADSQLRMIFACCHPKLSQEDQIALTLKVVSGFGTKEIANGLLKPIETIKKRIQRARNFLKTNQLQLLIPQGADLQNRLENVQLVLYLLFNEGYYSSLEKEHIRRDLCLEAMRLTKLLLEHPVITSLSNHALLALMCYHASRFDCRIDEEGQMVLLKDQDRSQ